MKKLTSISIFNFIIFLIILFVYSSCKKDEPNTAPVAVFIINPSLGNTDSIFTFDASGCTDNEETCAQLEVRWDWETDGIWDTQYSSVKTLEHQFHDEGSYTVTLEVKDSEGLTSTISKTISVALTNQAPGIPLLLFPEDNSIDNVLVIELSWTCIDPEGDPLSFDICFGTEPDPPLLESRWNDFAYENITTSGETTYFWKVVAMDNSGNITEGPVWSYNSGAYIFDMRDSLVYSYVTVGSQIWMAENLAYLPSVSPSSITDNDLPHYYVNGYEGVVVGEAKETDNYSIYGVLYNWEATNISCPQGWHLATDEEWQILEAFMGMKPGHTSAIGLRTSGDVGKKLKSTSGWYSGGDSNGIDSIGMNLLPGGLMENVMGVPQFKDPGKTFWTWTDTPNTGLYNTRYIMYNRDGIFRRSGATYKYVAGSLRCLKDE